LFVSTVTSTLEPFTIYETFFKFKRSENTQSTWEAPHHSSTRQPAAAGEATLPAFAKRARSARSSALEFGGFTMWPTTDSESLRTRFSEISRKTSDPTSRYEAHMKVAQATAARDSETIATAPESQANLSQPEPAQWAGRLVCSGRVRQPPLLRNQATARNGRASLIDSPGAREEPPRGSAPVPATHQHPHAKLGSRRVAQPPGTMPR
jgi:hypothetical protein